MKMGKRRLTCLLAAIMMALFAACGAAQGGAAQSAGSGETQEATPTAAQEKNGEVVILYTSDIHCGVEKGFGVGWLGWRCADAGAGRRVIDGLEMRGCGSRMAGIDILADIQYNCSVRRIVWEEPDSGERSGYGTL